MHAEEPMAEEKEPALHTMQVCAVVAARVELAVPAAHLEQAGTPAAVPYDPVLQMEQEVASGRA